MDLVGDEPGDGGRFTGSAVHATDGLKRVAVVVADEFGLVLIVGEAEPVGLNGFEQCPLVNRLGVGDDAVEIEDDGSDGGWRGHGQG